MRNLILMFIGLIKGNLIVINKKNNDEIKVTCGRSITREFAKRSFATSLKEML